MSRSTGYALQNVCPDFHKTKTILKFLKIDNITLYTHTLVSILNHPQGETDYEHNCCLCQASNTNSVTQTEQSTGVHIGR